MSSRIRYTRTTSESLAELVETKLVLVIVIAAALCVGWYVVTEVTPLFLRISAALESL
jgi:hypothetical protein